MSADYRLGYRDALLDCAATIRLAFDGLDRALQPGEKVGDVMREAVGLWADGMMRDADKLATACTAQHAAGQRPTWQLLMTESEKRRFLAMQDASPEQQKDATP